MNLSPRLALFGSLLTLPLIAGQDAKPTEKPVYPVTVETLCAELDGGGGGMEVDADGGEMVLVIEAGNDLCIATRGE